MAESAFIVLIIFLLFGLMGIGSASYFFKTENAVTPILLSPILGMTFTTIIGTYLVIWNIPIAKWAFWWLILSILMNYVFITFIKKLKKCDIAVLTYWLYGFLCVSALMLLPMVIGKLSYTLFRGNGTDSFNYMTMAGFLINQPYSAIDSHPVDLFIKHPTYVLAAQLLKDRWSVAMLLGWMSVVTRIPLYKIEYGFTILFFLFTYNIIFLFAKYFSKKNLHACVLGVATCVGFWSQFILDIRAFSHISVIPIFLFFSYVLILIESNKTEKNVPQLMLMGFLLTSIISLYPEILPTIALAISIYYFIEANFHKNKIRTLAEYKIIFFTVLLTLFPMIKLIFYFFFKQSNFLIQNKVDIISWSQAYFSWLYNKFLIGFWGLSLFYDADWSRKLFFASMLDSGLIALSICLTFIFGYSLIYMLCIKNKSYSIAFRIISSFMLAAFAQFIIFNALHRPWVSGKAISYCSSFIYLTIFCGFLLIHNWKIKNTLSMYLKRIGLFVISSWIILQFLLGPYRIAFAWIGREYSNYITFHGDHRRYNWNIETIVAALKGYPNERIGLKVEDPWIAEYLSFALGWKQPIVDLDWENSRAYSWIKELPVVSPKLLILNRDSTLEKMRVIASSKDFILVRLEEKRGEN